MAKPADSESNEENRYEDIYLARQPVFGKSMKVWAYELLYRDRKLAQNAVFLDEVHATVKVLAALPLCIDLTDENTHIIINFPARAIKEQMQTAYPKGTTIIQLTDDVLPDDDLLHAVKKLKTEGYSFSVDNYENDSERNSLYQWANYITLDFFGKNPKEVELLTHLCQSKFPKSELIAKRIEEYGTYRFAKELGFKKFQGFFFKAPQMHSGKKISATTRSKLSILKLLQKKEVEFKEIAKALSADLSIVHRLLAYINSPSMGLRSKVNSIEDALIIMGISPLKKWLQIILLADMAPKDQPHELVFLSAQRAYFFEKLAVFHQYEPIKSPLFLLGLFSLIDAILSHPKEELISKLSLGTELENALLGHPSKYTLWLQLVDSYEKSNWAELDRIARQLGFSSKGVSTLYEEAYQSAKSFF